MKLTHKRSQSLAQSHRAATGWDKESNLRTLFPEPMSFREKGTVTHKDRNDPVGREKVMGMNGEYWKSKILKAEKIFGVTV